MMTLSAGARLGPYELVSLIGAGGMGEVYRARDTRLDRPVAIKLLHPDLADRPDRRARFETEARAISSLSHPHICTLFDVGNQDGRQFLVMEYLEGQTLADRLTAGPLPSADVLRHATEIAGALDHAHTAGIVHRDLKPSNVMLTASGAKLLDFGVAKSPVVATGAPTSTLSFEQPAQTAEGTVIGTFRYMAPEQLEGGSVDSRTDIFAFGTLLYEMTTGRAPFAGKSQASLIASILTQQPPPISSTRKTTRSDPSLFALEHVVERCLAKNPEERWQTARDVKLELEWIAGSDHHMPVPALTGRRFHAREVLAWALAFVAVAAALGLTLGPLNSAPKDTTRFVVGPPSGTTIGVAENRMRIAISPDGRQLAFVGFTGGKSQVWLRSLDSVTMEPVPGTEGGQSPFWSPDSRFIGFFSAADGEIKRVDLRGGPARTISAAQIEGAPVWGRDGTILFTQSREGIFRVPAEGGTPARVTQVDKSKRELSHFWPQFLPDGRHFLYMATSVDDEGVRETPAVYVASLDSSDATLLMRIHSRVLYAPASPGHLLFVQEGALLAQAFDLANLSLTGEPVRIADGVAYSATLGNGGFAVSENGVLAYQGAGDPFSLTWFDRSGTPTDSTWVPETFGSLRMSPDGQRLAVDLAERRWGTADIWIYDVARGAPVRLTTDMTNEGQAVWSPDGEQLLFRWERSGAPSLYAKTIGSGAVARLASEPIPLTPEDWSSDGQWIVYVRQTRETSWDLWLMPMRGDRKPVPFSTTRFDEWSARFSPDSRWMAFVSTDSGSPEVYVAPVQEPGNRKRISTGGGTSPRWRRDGRELFYAAADDRSIIRVSIEPGSTFRSSEPTRLFSVGNVPAARDRARNVAYDVTPDGQRFLVSVPSGEPSSSRITVVLNWTAALAP